MTMTDADLAAHLAEVAGRLLLEVRAAGVFSPKALGKAGDDGAVTYPAGTVAMANTGQPGTGGSQFFLVYKDTKLPPSYTPFGTMDDAGLKAVQKVAEAGVAEGASDGAPKKTVTVEKVTVDKA